MAKIETREKLAITVTDAAEYLSVSRPMMYQILNREDCNVDFRVGTKRLISMKALQEWVDKQVMDNRNQST